MHNAAVSRKRTGASIKKLIHGQFFHYLYLISAPFIVIRVNSPNRSYLQASEFARLHRWKKINGRLAKVEPIATSMRLTVVGICLAGEKCVGRCRDTPVIEGNKFIPVHATAAYDTLSECFLLLDRNYMDETLLHTFGALVVTACVVTDWTNQHPEPWLCFCTQHSTAGTGCVCISKRAVRSVMRLSRVEIRCWSAIISAIDIWLKLQVPRHFYLPYGN